MREPTLLDVPVNGGTLRVARWGTSGPLVLAPHGITASWISWRFVAEKIGHDLVFVAPDLRGRGESSTLPPPYGMAQHAEDCRAILDHLDTDRCVVAGHSMGGWVAAALATVYPERVTAVIVSDGGFPLADAPAGRIDIDAVLDAVIGPAMARLSMTFASREEYLDYWRAHPAFADPSVWTDVVRAYFEYDLIGREPALRSRVSLDAVRADAIDTLVHGPFRDAATRIEQPLTWLRAERGMFNGPPLYGPEAVDRAKAAVPHMNDVLVPDVNHYTLVMSDAGAEVVADHIRKAVGVG